MGPIDMVSVGSAGRICGPAGRPLPQTTEAEADVELGLHGLEADASTGKSRDDSGGRERVSEVERRDLFEKRVHGLWPQINNCN